MSTSRELARRLLAAMPETDHAPTTEARLAIAVSQGLGVVRDTRPGRRDLYVVLGPMLDAMPLSDRDHIPVFLVGAVSKTEHHRRVHRTDAVARFFQGRARNLGADRPVGYTARWAPGATNSLAMIAIDGHLSDDAPTTPDASGFSNREGPNVYEWFDLEKMPIGSLVYRIDSIGWLYLYQRVSSKYWGRVCIRVTTDVVNVHGILAEMHAESGGILELDELDGPTPLMRQPPDTKKPNVRTAKSPQAKKKK